MRKGKCSWRTACIVCVLVIAIVDLLMTTQISSDIRELRSLPQKRQSLPCGAIPTRFIMDAPECANTLLRLMNVSNVQIRPVGSNDSLQGEIAERYLQRSVSQASLWETRNSSSAEEEKSLPQGLRSHHVLD